jgi:hypothetical protein
MSLLTASGARADAGYMLKWYEANGTTQYFGAGNPINTSTQGDFTYYVSQVNNATQCESGKVSVTIRITTPIVVETCAGDSVTYNANTLYRGISPSYQWYKNGSIIPGATDTVYTYPPENGDVVMCRLVVSGDACFFEDTVFSRSVTAIVHPLPVLTQPSNRTLCHGGSSSAISFSGTNVNSSATMWAVTYGSGIAIGMPANSGTGNIPAFTAIASGAAVPDTVVITVTPKSTDNCTGAPKTFRIVVSPAPTPSVSISASSTNICAGTNITFTATPTNEGDNPTYQWKKNGVNVGSNSATYSDNTLSNNDTIICVLTTSLTCYTQPTATSNKLVVKSCAMRGTVFPFVHDTLSNGTPDTAFNKLFPVTAALYAIPVVGSTDDPVGSILNTAPLFTAKVKHYDGSVWYPDIPKYPGEILRTNNPGIPIHWDELVNPSTIPPVNTATLAAAGDLPDAFIGIYSFENVPPGDYILVLSRSGYVSRFSEITILAEGGFLGHRELVLGDVNWNMQVENVDVSDIKQRFSIFANPDYKARYDINADRKVDAQDVSSVNRVTGFSVIHYSDSRTWILRY